MTKYLVNSIYVPLNKKCCALLSDSKKNNSVWHIHKFCASIPMCALVLLLLMNSTMSYGSSIYSHAKSIAPMKKDTNSKKAENESSNLINIYTEFVGPLYSFPCSLNIDYSIPDTDNSLFFVRAALGANPFIRIINSGVFVGRQWGRNEGLEVSGGVTWSWYSDIMNFNTSKIGISPCVMMGYRIDNHLMANYTLRFGAGVLYNNFSGVLYKVAPVVYVSVGITI